MTLYTLPVFPFFCSLHGLLKSSCRPAILNIIQTSIFTSLVSAVLSVLLPAMTLGLRTETLRMSIVYLRMTLVYIYSTGTMTTFTEDRSAWKEVCRNSTLSTINLTRTVWE